MAERPTIVEFALALAQCPGIEPPTPRWMATLRCLYGLHLTDDDVSILATVTGRSPAALRSYEGYAFEELWARVGRRGRKSATAALITDYEALYGGHEAHLMPGELGMIVTISKDLAGAELVRRFQHLFLDALGIAHHETKFGAVAVTIIEGSPLVLACLTCTTESPRGPAIPVAILDEPAFYPTNIDAADPDTQIIGALRPAMAQFPNRKLLAISSPWGILGEFHATVERALGSDDSRHILAVQGPTWQWNPKVTEEVTHRLEPNEAVWRREYAAIPSSSLSGEFFTADSVETAFTKRVPSWMLKQGGSAVFIDASGGHNDNYWWLVASVWAEDPLQILQLNTSLNPIRSPISGMPFRRADRPETEPIIKVEWCDFVPAPFHATHKPSQIVQRIVEDASRFRASTVHGDQFSEHCYEELFRAAKCRFVYHPLTSVSKGAGCNLVRQWFDSRNIVIDQRCPGADTLKKELLVFQEVMRPGGTFTYGAPRGMHDDSVSCLIQMALAAQSDDPRSKFGRESPRGVVTDFPRNRRFR